MDGVLKHLSNKKHDSNYLFSTLYSYLGDHLLNEKFRSFIQQRLRCRKNRFDQRLFDWLTPSTKTKRGRPSHSDDTRQVCFDMWVENSIISVDRRDGRDVIKIPRTAFENQYYGIETSLVTFSTKRNVEVAQAPRYLCTVSAQKMLEKIKQALNQNISYGSVVNFCPFLSRQRKTGVPLNHLLEYQTSV